jgi:Family of unknown function (DUF6600)
MNQFMKNLLFVLAVFAIFLPAAPQAKSQEVSINFFYDNLNAGNWIEVGNYGYCWQPDVAVNDPNWRPYADGYWAYTDLGWTWVSYEDFGWVTYHYGRWVRLTDIGWVWVPGYEWGPAWVSWRFGGGYCGWAPLPPETEVVYESRPLSGHLDVEFDIGPGYYNFVDVRYIGEPVLRSRIVNVNENVTYINQTVNVTNITYKNKTVYNYGPDLNVVNQYSSRPVQRLKLEQQANVSSAQAGGFTKVQGNALVVAAPKELKKPTSPPPPPAVKTTIAQPKIEKGWSVAGDANAQAQLKEKIKAQNLKNVPPPTTGANGAALGAGASVSRGGSIAPGMAPAEKGKRKGKGAERFQAGAGASASPGAAVGPISPGANPAVQGRGKGKGKAREQTQPGTTTTPMTSPGVANSPSTVPEPGKPAKARPSEQFGQPPAGPSTSAEQLNEQRGGKNGKFEQPGMSPSGPQNTPSGPQGGPYGEGRGKHQQFEQQQPGVSPAGAQGAGPSGEERAKRRSEGVNAPPPSDRQQLPSRETGEKKHEGKQKGAASATPGPQ